MSRRMPSMLVACGALAMLASCTSETDFRKTAENAIEMQFRPNGRRLRATCQTPNDTTVGTNFGCTATLRDDPTKFYRFSCTITKENALDIMQVIDVAQNPGGA